MGQDVTSSRTIPTGVGSVVQQHEDADANRTHQQEFTFMGLAVTVVSGAEALKHTGEAAR